MKRIAITIMVDSLFRVLVPAVLLVWGVQVTSAELTVECVPIGGTTVTAGETVEVECYVVTDVEQNFIFGPRHRLSTVDRDVRYGSWI